MVVARYLGTRLALAIVTLLLISIITFLATNVVPSDPARIALGKTATPAQIRAFNQQQGLDKPALTRYVDWLSQYLQGNWGKSTLNSLPVEGQVVPRLKRSFLLAVLAMLIAVPLAFILGVYTGQRTGSKSDLTVSSGALVLNSQPEFVVAIVLIVVFGVVLQALPVESSGVAYGNSQQQAYAYVLPVVTLSLVLFPYILRMVRVNVRDVLQEPFVRTTTLRGLPRRAVVWRHVVPNASLPVVNVIALSMAELIGGVVVVETVLGFPGIGQLFVSSVFAKDLPTVQAITMVIGLGYVTLNFAADAILLLLNPRLRTG